jgi:hypothetical protein
VTFSMTAHRLKIQRRGSTIFFKKVWLLPLEMLSCKFVGINIRSNKQQKPKSLLPCALLYILSVCTSVSCVFT